MIKRLCLSPLAAPSVIRRLVGSRLSLTGLLISGLTLWACGGKETAGPSAQ